MSTNGARRAALAVAGAFVGRAVLGGLRAVGVRWERTNYRGRTVDLAGGPALGTAATVTAAAGALIGGQPAAAGAALTAGLGAGGVGLYDDVVGGRPEHQAKGFHGHVRALRRGRVTSGVVKIVGAGAAGLAAAALLEVGRPARSRWHRLTRIALGAGVVAGGANLFNLLDLRPGRALKAGVLAGAPLMASASGGLAAGPVGACLGLLPDDLREQIMLGDSGANTLGALLGVAFNTRFDVPGRAAALATIGALTAASERISFTKVIAQTPGLREIDELGRRRD